METLPHLLESAAAWQPEHPFLIFAEEVMTYGQANAGANRLAHGLLRLGIPSAVPVALYLPSRPLFPVAYYGVLKSGAIAAPLNFMFRSGEVRQMVHYLGAPALLTTAAGYQVVAQVRHELPGLRHVMVLREPGDPPAPAGTVDLEPLLAEMPDTNPPQHFTPDAVATIFHTSGTTGVPKGAAQTHLNTVIGTRQMTVFTGYRPGKDRLLCALPLFNNFGATAVLNLVVNNQATMVLLERWDTQAVIDAMVEHRCNRFVGTPTMYIYLLQGHQPAVHGEIRLDPCLVAGQRCPVEVRTAFQARFGCTLVDAYGATETHFATATPMHGPRREGTVGFPVGATQIRIVDDAGNPVPPGTVGEIVIGSDTVCQGYWQNSEMTAESFGPDGWRSGDLGYLDGDGYLYIVDRKKDLIITGGANIYPGEVESVLYTHPAVGMAAVIGVPDPVKGEIPRAYVVCREGSSVTAAELIAFCREHLAVYKCPREVVFTDSLPLSAIGKVLRRELRERAKVELRQSDRP